MSAILTQVIQKQGFEIVRDQIAIVLKTELEQQKTLQELTDEINVYSERITPIGDDEKLLINILLDSAIYSQKTQTGQEGRTLYFIDLYTNGYATNVTGTSDSSPRLHKYMGIVRYILSATAYKTLNLPLGLIAGTQLESFNTLDPNLKEDGGFTRFARLQFSVRIYEQQEMWQGVELFGADATVKLAHTERGYKYVLNIK